MSFSVGESVWVDEGDSVGCYEFGGMVESVAPDGTLSIRVTSQPILAGVPTGSLRDAHPDFVLEIVAWEEL